MSQSRFLDFSGCRLSNGFYVKEFQRGLVAGNVSQGAHGVQRGIVHAWPHLEGGAGAPHSISGWAVFFYVQFVIGGGRLFSDGFSTWSITRRFTELRYGLEFQA